MNIEISPEKLKQVKLFVATPMYGGMAHGLYLKSCLDLQGLCIKHGIDVKFSFIFNESLITRARNYLVDEFLRSGYTHLLFIDADIHFDPRDVIALVALNKDIVGGPYPKKTIKWPAIKDAVQRHPQITPQELEKLGGDFVFNAVAGTQQFQVNEPLQVMEIGTGFMLVQKYVFDKFKEAYPEFKYKPDHLGQEHFDGSRFIHAYFDTVIDRGASERYLSEDYMFCQWARKIGLEVWLCPWMKTHHVGTYAFTGDMPAVANYIGAL